MELREGYKQTDLGFIPDDWEIVSLGELATVKTGPFGSSLHESDYVEDGTPIITVEHLGEHGVIHANLPMVSDTDRSRLKAYSLKENDIVFSRVGSVDRNALIRGPEVGWLFSGRLLRVRPKSDGVNSQYLSYHFHSKPFKNRVLTVAVGQTMASLNTQILKEIDVVVPTKKEQRAIATALSDVDTLITALDKLIAKKRAIKTATMQQLLTGKQRLPGFGDDSDYKHTVMGEIPNEWEVKELGFCICCGRLGGNYPNQDVLSSRPLMKMGNLDRSRMDLSKIEYIPDNEIVDPRHRLNYGDVLFNTRNTLDLVGKVAIWREELPRAYYNSNLMRLEFDQKVISSPVYANYALNSRRSIEQFRSVATGTTSVAAIYTRDLMQFPMIVPPKEEQLAIATVLSDMETEITALEFHLTKTKAIKQGMMQELLTGRTRLV